MKKFGGLIALTLAALIWGCAFVSQSVGMDYVKPFTFNCVRSLVGGLALLVFVIVRALVQRRSNGDSRPAPLFSKKTLIGGIICGIVIFAASNLQQMGIVHTTVGKAGFITAFYIVLVPILGIFIGKKNGLRVWLCVAIALVGLYLLCINESFDINRGDLLILACALVFSIHILVIDRFLPEADGVGMSCIQFLVCGLLSVVPMLMEKPTLTAIGSAYLPILYAGVMSCGVAYTLQIVGQRDVKPGIAALVLSLESVFAVLAGWVLLKESLSSRELIGCGLMFLAIILSQLPQRKRDTNTDNIKETA